MSAHWHYRDNAGVAQELQQQVRRLDMELTTNAEEGSVGTSQIPVVDPGATFDVRGHRIVSVIEDAIDPDSDDGAGVIWVGYTASRDIGRGVQQVEDDRDWTLTVVDLNTVLDREIGTADDWDRPAETDVARLQWLLTTEETSLIDDTTYVSLVNPVNMDANDYRKSRVRDVLDSMAQQSGKNWFLTWVQHPDGGNDIEYSLWYDFAASSNWSSTVRISNDLDDVDSTTIFAPAHDTKLVRDPSRVISKVIVDYDGGWVPVERTATATAFALGGRDATMAAPWIKTKASAVRYGKRVLSDVATEEDTISTAIVVDAARVNKVMAGMRIQCKFTHFDFTDPDYTEWTWFRVLNRTIREIGPDVYEIALELTTPVAAAEGGALYGVLLHSHGFATSQVVWEREGGPETAFPATSGAISAIVDSAKPDKRDHTGWLIEGDGTIDVTFHASVTAVLSGSVTVTWAILNNGVVVASNAHVSTGGLRRYSDSETVTVSSLSVANGDVVTATITPVGLNWFFTIPAGVGTQNERLEITGGSLA